MSYPVPPSFDLEETSLVSFVGVGMRELLIVGGGLLLGIMAGVALPAGWPIKIAVGTMLAGFGFWLAIGREPGTNRKFEEVFLDYIRFRRRPKVHQRDFVQTQEVDDPFSTPDEFEYSRPADTEEKKGRIAEAAWDVSLLPEKDQISIAAGWFKVRPLPLTGAVLLNILGLALLAGLIAWVWLGGLKSLLSGISGF